MRFSLLTYNIHKAIGVDRKFSPERIAEVIEHHSVDIVLLQEVDRGAPRSNHLDLASHFARMLRYDYRAVGINVYLRRGKYGNATLTRYPITHQCNVDLTIGRRKRRGAQHARVTVGDGVRRARLDVFNLHLGLLAGERKRQVARLLAAAPLAHLSEDDPCIIAGDLNDWRNLLRRQLEPAGFRCASNHGRWSIKTFPSYAPAGGLDKIFYRGRLKARNVFRSRLKAARLASDHLPLIAEFELEA